MKRMFLIILTSLIIVSCDIVSAVSTDEPEKQEIVKNKYFEPILLTKAQERIAQESNAFGLGVFAELMSDYATTVGKDLVISPLSLSSALSMCVNGAEGRTKEQMLDVLGYEGFTIEEMNSYYDIMLDALVRADEKVDFLSANSVWHEKDILLYEEYKENLANVFDASVNEVESLSDEAVIHAINEWCSDKTNGKIETFLEEGQDDGDVKLINALYFGGEWTTEFEKPISLTFNHETGTVSRLETVTGIRTLEYVENESFKLVEIPYGNSAFVMDFILPQEGLSIAGAAADLDMDVLRDMFASLTEEIVKLQFPVFEIEYGKEMTQVLMDMGMTSPFLDADFSKMSPTDMVISSVMQKSYINVSEKGTEAASVTDVTLEDAFAPEESGAGVKIRNFIADRPFFFMIRESSTGVILFIGKKA